MTLAHSHDAIRVESPRHNELPDGVPAPAAPIVPPAAARVGRSNGRIASAELARELGRRGGLARAALGATLRSLECMGLRPVAGCDLTVVAPFLADGEALATHECARLAQVAGGGHCGAGPTSMIQTGALELAASRYLFSTGDPSQFALAARLGDAARQNFAMAFELVCKEAKARASARDPMADLSARLGLGEAT
jgi:hypothetical protein